MKILTHGKEQSLSFFAIRVPSRNEQRESVMSKCLEAMHHLLPHNGMISLEMRLKNQLLSFFIVTPSVHESAVISQLHAYFPEVEIEKISDYLPDYKKGFAAEMHYKYTSAYPLKTFLENHEGILKSLTAILTKIDPRDEFYFQTVFLKIDSHPLRRGFKITYDKLVTKDPSAQEKLSHELYRGSVRLAYVSDEVETAKKTLQTIGGVFKHLDGKNKLQLSFLTHNDSFWQVYRERIVNSSDVFTPQEIASMYHFPYKGSGISSNSSTSARQAPSPDILPLAGIGKSEDITLFGETTYQSEKKVFGIKRDDRRRHMYVIGKTGSGKSRMLQLLLLSDINNGDGCCLIDPHGDLAEELLSYIPKNRISDVVYVNPADKDFPIGFNPLEAVEDYETRQHLSRFFIAIFKKLFADSWNPRMEHLIRYITLALLETPDSNILGMQRILTDVNFRQRVIKQIKDPVVKSFWTTEFSASNEQFISAAAVPLMNKLGQFIAHPTIRNMVGQRKNMLDFEKFMNKGKIVIINLPKGKLGEDNVALLGSMFITKIQQAALARAKMKEEERRDFYFYVDEFQNFATDAFSSILSESRKYHLNITVAHQYMAQLTEEIKTAVFGNIASLVVFSVGGNDARYLEHEFAPVFDKEDMLSLEAREMYIKLCIDGRLTQPFSARTLTIPTSDHDYSSEIITKSQMTYGINKVTVENEIRKWSDTAEFVESEKSQTFPEPLV